MTSEAIITAGADALREMPRPFGSEWEDLAAAVLAVCEPLLRAEWEAEYEQADEDAHGYSRTDLLFGGNWS